MTILDKIIAQKKIEVEILGKQTIEQKSYPKIETFYNRIKAKESMGIISEIKRAPPSKGMINEGIDPIQQAKLYADNGASAISVLTDEQFFKGSMDDLRAVRAIVDVPILCKDFMIDTVQIDLAKAAGANIILLIAAALDDAKMKELYDYAIAADLEVLCEVHDEEEMTRVLALNPKIIGVNNRNLKTFEVDLNNTIRLASMVTDPAIIFISESGIETRADVEKVAEVQTEVVLVGETLMRADDVAATLQDLQIPLAPKVGG